MYVHLNKEAALLARASFFCMYMEENELNLNGVRHNKSTVWYVRFVVI